MLPAVTVMAQVPGQSIPAGDDVTRPEPVPVNVTITRALPGGGGDVAENVAVMSRSAFIETSQAPVPLQPPCQPLNFQPESGTATRCAFTAELIVCWQSPRQENAGLEDRTWPFPETRRCSVCCAAPDEPVLLFAGGELLPHATANATPTAQPIPRMHPSCTGKFGPGRRHSNGRGHARPADRRVFPKAAGGPSFGGKEPPCALYS